jgi:hypothetical protein
MSKRKKKSKRTRSQSRRNTASNNKQAPEAPTVAPADETPWREYAYVNKDLRQVTILAAAMFALLIALSFFIG